MTNINNLVNLISEDVVILTCTITMWYAKKRRKNKGTTGLNIRQHL